MYGLTPREEQIMNTIWNMDHPCLISEILKASPALKRNTVAPALVLLENKGYLKVDSIGKSYTRTGKAYVAAISKEAYKEQQAFLNAISQSRDTETGVLDFLAPLLFHRVSDHMICFSKIKYEFSCTPGNLSLPGVLCFP